MDTTRFRVAAGIALAIWALSANAQQAPTEKPRQLSLENNPRKGDFDQMLERRLIRVLVAFSRTLYFVDHGTERGVTADLVREFEQYLKRKYAKQLGKRPLTVVMIPTTRDKLLPGVVAGLGDIAAANLTGDLQAARNRVTYYESVLALNRRLRSERRAPVKIVLLPDALEDEYNLDMLNAGLLQLAIVGDLKARIWAQILPKIKVRADLVLRAEDYTGRAMRKGSTGA